MKPAFSVIFFTVSSGAGLGLIALLVLADTLQWGNRVGDSEVLIGGIVALALITAGLFSSTLHLANPKNAWRSFSRFKTSWLSREGVFAILFYPFALGYLGLVYFGIGGFQRVSLGIATVLLAWAVLYCTGMIYGSLKPIPQWHTPLVPAAYFVLGHYSGALLLLVVLAYGANDSSAYHHLALAWLALGVAVKGLYYAWIGKTGVTPTINTAIGISRARVRLLDTGHTHGTFLTNEFGYTIARRHALLGKMGVFVIGFFLPFLALTVGKQAMASAIFAAGAAIIGLLLERWYFFAEARHVVRLYHGQ